MSIIAPSVRVPAVLSLLCLSILALALAPAPAFAAEGELVAPLAPLPEAQAAPAPAESGLCSVSATGPLATGVRSLDRPVPFPQYCDDCRPCSVQGHCGVQGGYYLGVCSPNPSYCGYPGYAACVCY